MLDFLKELFEQGASASSIGTHRSALSLFLPKVEGYKVGDHPLMVRFMRGIHNKRPPQPRYKTTWDSNLVVEFLKTYSHDALKALTQKVTMLLALVTAQRAQTLSKLRLSEMTDIGDDRIVFRIGAHLKTKRPGTAVITLKAFPSDPRICVVTLIRLYVEKTKLLRQDDSLLVSPVKPHKAVHIDTIRRWIMNVMKLAGIDVNLFKPHSTRAASTSKAKLKMVPMNCILDSGMWTNETTFSKFYDKSVVQEDDVGVFQNAILNTS